MELCGAQREGRCAPKIQIGWDLLDLEEEGRNGAGFGTGLGNVCKIVCLYVNISKAFGFVGESCNK